MLCADALLADLARDRQGANRTAIVPVAFETVQMVCGAYTSGNCSARHDEPCAPGPCPYLARHEAPPHTRPAAAIDRRTFTVKAAWTGVLAAVGLVGRRFRGRRRASGVVFTRLGRRSCGSRHVVGLRPEHHDDARCHVGWWAEHPFVVCADGLPHRHASAWHSHRARSRCARRGLGVLPGSFVRRSFARGPAQGGTVLGLRCRVPARGMRGAVRPGQQTLRLSVSRFGVQRRDRGCRERAGAHRADSSRHQHGF